MSILTAIKTLGAKLIGGTTTAADISGTDAAAALASIATLYSRPTDGTNGKSVTAIALTTDANGAVTGGTATLSDDSTVDIAVTAEAAGE